MDMAICGLCIPAKLAKLILFIALICCGFPLLELQPKKLKITKSNSVTGLMGDMVKMLLFILFI